MSEAVKELINIVIKLRSDNGCDWDRKQTSESLTPHLIEEANEVVDAVLENNSENLKEELGDLLLHVVFQAVIASEKKSFDFEEVVHQINKNRSFEGKSVEVLVENRMQNQLKLFGRNKFNNSVIFVGDENNIGKIVKVKIESTNQNSLFGKIENNKAMKAA